MPTILTETYEQHISRFLERFKLVPIFVSFFLVLFSIFFVRDLAQRSVWGAQRQALPFPGMLPDHPLYPLKQARDNFMLLTTRAPLNKAQLYLHLADKSINAANMVTDCAVATKTAIQSQKYLLNQRQALLAAKEMGLTPEITTITGNRMSIKEHGLILKDIGKRCKNKEERTELTQATKLHDSFSRWFDSTYTSL
ncbi:hypothetical protein COU89_03365 [Candidatus Roizmanbacteria bacterium CG10_big_fil_rev_8_21_14_0_10_45_7]|uniref:DUF5667 domain-containing protein n=1 Tax=Candidatus Roizmanbacteria bacterium CG10_big_fil_rev_8_21_14_0_10_45_7 TaxID=1974854 RepID=A0A2M8KU27_9BACT|nr:MAG: hypothetical protein COU89_03365 [Candidatus Roizmanbacteria bacterium CG10_big_fil_rev_8_21_14_0_10_45_7]